MDDADGDVRKAAAGLDVRPRTMYNYLDTEKALSHVKTSTEKSTDLEDKKFKKTDKKKKEKKEADGS